MRFGSCRQGDRRFAAMIEGDWVRPLRSIEELGRETDSDLLTDPPLTRRSDRVLLSDVELLPVVPSPQKIVCLGLNYRAHVDETGRKLPEYPVFFCKFPSSLIGPGAAIRKPPESDQVDYEAELAVVVGRRARRVSVEEASRLVAGYSVANDVTVRDFQYLSNQWLQGKAWDGTTPVGPFLVTPDEVGDPGTLDIRLRLNGEQMQSSNTELMIFGVATILSRLSQFMTLTPGDLILTGTPGGVGYRRDPQVFLSPNDHVTVEIERVGILENSVIAE